MITIRNNHNRKYIGVIFSHNKKNYLGYSLIRPKKSWSPKPETSIIYIESGIDGHQSTKIYDLTTRNTPSEARESEFKSKLKNIINQELK